MEKKKKYGFFENVVTGLTGKTPDQRKADAILKNQIQQKQLASYRARQLEQAENVGKARADWEAKQQISNIGKPKPLINIGNYGLAQQGFDPFSFGETPAHKQVKGKIKQFHEQAPKLFNLSEAIGFEGQGAFSSPKKKKR
jgi:hypothetical protein